jgi:L-fuconolactonase
MPHADTVVDAHVHVWNPEAVHYPWLTHDLTAIDRVFTVGDAAPELRAQGVGHVVLVQSADNRADSENMLNQALGNPEVAGVVAWVPLVSPDDTAAQLDAWRSEPVVGVRHMVHLETDPSWLLRDDVGKSLGLLADRRMTFDVSAETPTLLAHVTLLAERHPDLTLVLDHLAKPPIAALRSGHRAVWNLWASMIAEIAQAPNVVAKVSGLNTAAGPGWTVDDLRPAVDHALEVFGPSRLMIGSDWPLALLAASSYTEVWTATRETLGGLGEADRAEVLGGTAARVYGLTV